MDLFQYVAENPKSQKSAINLCQDYGLEPQDDGHLADCLSQIVQNCGEDGLKEVMKIHPDRDIIINYYSIPPDEDSQRVANMITYKGADGSNTESATTGNNNTALQTNIIIFAAAVLIGFAIISKN
jgi:hypothetical protein